MNEADHWTPVLVGLGSNLGDRRASIEQAVALIGREKTVRWRCVSNLVETQPQGGPPQDSYLNGAGELVTCLSPWALLTLFHRVEAELGRVRTVPHGPRVVDVDILTYGNRVIDSDCLVIPHPRLCDRSFVLEPLVEIVPNRTHPLSGRTFREHLEELVARQGGARREQTGPGESTEATDDVAEEDAERRDET